MQNESVLSQACRIHKESGEPCTGLIDAKPISLEELSGLKEGDLYEKQILLLNHFKIDISYSPLGVEVFRNCAGIPPYGRENSAISSINSTLDLLLSQSQF